MALELTQPGQTAVLRRRMLALAESRRRSGRMTEAMTAFADAAEATAAGDADGTGPEADVDTRVAAALGYEEALFASRLPREDWGGTGINLLERAIDAVGSSADGTRARLLAALGRARTYRGEDGAPMSRAAVALARDTDDSAALAHALLALRASQTAADDLPDRLAAGAEIIDAARRSGDEETLFEGLRLRVIDLLEAGDVDGAEAAGRRASDVSFAPRQPQYMWYPAMWAAMRALFLGELDEAAELIERFRRHGRRWPYRDVTLVHAVQAMHLHIERGEPDRGLPLIEALHRENPARWEPTAAYAYACAGRIDKARRWLDDLAERNFADLPRDLSRVYIGCLLIECAATVDRPAARQLAASSSRGSVVAWCSVRVRSVWARLRTSSAWPGRPPAIPSRPRPLSTKRSRRIASWAGARRWPAPSACSTRSNHDRLGACSVLTRHETRWRVSGTDSSSS
jgi:hypothetical protein